MKKITLKVKGMHCPSCEMLVKDSLDEFDGIVSVSASFKEGTVDVEFDESAVSMDKVKTIIRNEGYKVA